MKNNYCVYIHRNIINNKSYIGITKHGDNPERRWTSGNGYLTKNKDGKYNQARFANAIQKYGWHNFEHIIWANNLHEYEAKKLEAILIALFNTTDSNYGYNISPGGESFSMTDLDVVKRTTTMLDTKRQNRIQKSIDMFKARFDDGDDNVLQCQKCGAYFEKEKSTNNKRDASKSQKYRLKRKYCDYCAKYHKRTKKIVICIDCGKEFVVKSRDNRTCRCEECKQK